jgi:hypothetical protein
MAIETDYEFYRQLGSVAAFTAYIGRFMGAVSAVFNRDIKVNLDIGYLSIWTTPDDPWSATTALAASTELGDYWHANRTSVQRSLVHFLSAKPLGGFAVSDDLCQDDLSLGDGHWLVAGAVSGGITDSFDTISGSGYAGILLVCHEIGHNVGSRQTATTRRSIRATAASPAATSARRAFRQAAAR